MRSSATSRIVTYIRFRGYMVGLCDDWMAADLLHFLEQMAIVADIFRSVYSGRFGVRYEACGRCNFGDDTLRQLDTSFEQIVILGAGNDTRFHRMPNLPGALFEVDAPKTQAAKLQKLTRVNPNVKFVPVDFEHEFWLDKLIASGFRKDQKTAFLWEGVLYYLSQEAIQTTLQGISQCAKGSKLILDYLVVVDPGPLLDRHLNAVRGIGEPYLSLLTDEQVAGLLEHHGLIPDGPPTWAEDAAKERQSGPRSHGMILSPGTRPPARMRLLSATLA
jgi:methyltransferase (TIGR00027 family)